LQQKALPEVARILRDDLERVRRLRRRFDRPLNPAEEKEVSELQARIAETARTINCPANYGLKEAKKDRERLESFFSRRHFGSSALSEAEVAEEAQLAARVAAYNESPEARAWDRMFYLSLCDFSEGLSDAEAEELESLQKAYPSNDDDDPLREAYEALGQAPE